MQPIHPDPYLKLVKKQNNKVTPATFKRGLIVNVYSTSWSADVIIIGNSQTILKNVPLSSAISPSNIRAGDKCRIDMFDETNQDDMVVAYTYGRSPNTSVLVNHGFVSLNSGNYQAVAHGLSGTPNIISVSTWPGSVPSGGGEPAFAWVTQNGTIADATNIYVDVVSSAGVKEFYWAAAIIS